MTAGERITLLRTEYLKSASGKAMSMEAFGNKLDLTKSMISQIESGNAILTDRTRKSICREFNVNEEWLLTGEGDVFLAKSVNDEIAAFVKELSTDNESFKAQLVTMLSRMSSDEWDLLEKMIRRLANLDEVAPVQQTDTAEAEAEYKKIHLENATKPAGMSSASNTTEGADQTA